MTAGLHLVHGVGVECDLPVSRHPLVEGEADVVVELSAPVPMPPRPPAGELLLTFANGPTPLYSAATHRSGSVLRVHGLCDLELSADGRRALCRPTPAADPEKLALAVRGAFLAFWLALRGEPVLHASAVESDGSAVVFVGDSGSGKSTLAAWACARGWRFLSDDLLRLGPGRPPSWVGCSPELRIRLSASELAQPFKRQWQVRPSIDGRLAALPPSSALASGPIGAVVVPRPSRSVTSLELSRLDPLDAVFLLSRFARLQGWKSKAGMELQLDGAARVADSIAVFVATVPWGPPFGDREIDELLERVRDGSPHDMAALR